MRKIAIFCLFYIFSSCINPRKLEKECIFLYSKYTIKDNAGQVLIEDSVGNHLLINKDYILCELETTLQEVVNNEFKHSSKKYGYLYFKSKNKIGQYIQSEDSLKKQINVKIDSAFNFYSSTLNQNFYDPIRKGNLKPIESIYDKNELTQKYSFYDSVQKAYGEWHLFFTEKYKNLPFSISEQLDSITKMKLFKLRIMVFDDLKDKKKYSIIEIGFQKSNDSIKREMIKWQGVHDSINNIH